MNKKTTIGFILGFVGTWVAIAHKAHSEPPYVGIPDPKFAAIGGVVGAIAANVFLRS